MLYCLCWQRLEEPRCSPHGRERLIVADAPGNTLQRLEAKITGSPSDPDGSQKQFSGWKKSKTMRSTTHFSVCKLKHVQTDKQYPFCENIYEKQLHVERNRKVEREGKITGKREDEQRE